MILHEINAVVNKNEIFSDLSVVAIKAWKSLLQMLSHMYDQKNHQAAMLIIKQITQLIIRKLDKEVQSAKKKAAYPTSSYFVQQNLMTPFKIVVESLLDCLNLFPGSYKQIVSTNRQ